MLNEIVSTGVKIVFSSKSKDALATSVVINKNVKLCIKKLPTKTLS